MDKVTTNQVRQILMNELGLTRESVRQLTVEVVNDIAVKYFDNLEKSGNLQQIIEKAFSNKYRGAGGYPYDSFQNVLLNAAQEAARDFVDKNISIKTI